MVDVSVYVISGCRRSRQSLSWVAIWRTLCSLAQWLIKLLSTLVQPGGQSVLHNDTSRKLANCRGGICRGLTFSRNTDASETDPRWTHTHTRINLRSCTTLSRRIARRHQYLRRGASALPLLAVVFIPYLVVGQNLPELTAATAIRSSLLLLVAHPLFANANSGHWFSDITRDGHNPSCFTMTRRWRCILLYQPSILSSKLILIGPLLRLDYMGIPSLTSMIIFSQISDIVVLKFAQVMTFTVLRVCIGNVACELDNGLVDPPDTPSLEILLGSVMEWLRFVTAICRVWTLLDLLGRDLGEKGQSLIEGGCWLLRQWAALAAIVLSPFGCRVLGDALHERLMEGSFLMLHFQISGRHEPPIRWSSQWLRWLLLEELLGLDRGDRDGCSSRLLVLVLLSDLFLGATWLDEALDLVLEVRAAPLRLSLVVLRLHLFY